MEKKEKVEAKKEMTDQTTAKAETKVETKTEEKKEPVKKEIVKTKRTEAMVVGKNLIISKKHAMYLSRFVKFKTIDAAIADLERVIIFKKVVPMKGEIPHRKGPGMMSGRYPINASKVFIQLLKGLKGNSIMNGMALDKTKIVYGSATWDARPMRSGGRKGKRVHIVLKAKEEMKNG